MAPNERDELPEDRRLEELGETIAERWYEAVSLAGVSALSATELHASIGQLAREAVTLLAGETFDSREREGARAIGQKLAGLHYPSPGTLAGIHESLAKELSKGLASGSPGSGDAPNCLDRLSPGSELNFRKETLAAEIAGGFFGGARQAILDEQERIKDALLAEREETRQELKRSEASLAEAQRVAHLGHWELRFESGGTAQSGELHWSEEIFRIFGVSKGTFGRSLGSFRERVHPDDLGMVDEIGEAASAGEPTNHSFEHRVVRPSGEVRMVHQRIEPTTDETGRPTGLVGTVQDVTERRALEERLEYQAMHDHLTGLANRAYFMQYLTQVLEASSSPRCTGAETGKAETGKAEAGAAGPGARPCPRGERRGRGRAVLFVDLNDFKLVNDSLGHAAGDELLVEVARRLEDCLRDEDVVARFGGDEFAIALEKESPSGAAAVAERILKRLREPLLLRGQEIFILATIGIALDSASRVSTSGVSASGDCSSTPPAGQGAERLLAEADRAMYRAKVSGRGCAVFEPEVDERSLGNLTLSNELVRAIERGELVVHYQPKVSLLTEQTVGLEALVRWEHPRRGLLYPDEFVPLAEQNGSIVSLGLWVFEEICRKRREWTADDLTISVNLSARQLRDPALARELARIVEECGVAPEGLELEITESAVMERAEQAAEQLSELKSVGFRLAIDDFGTGYSSLAYLKLLPVDELKIDKTFISGLQRDRKDYLIVSSTVSLAKALGLEVTAEGVETPGQLAALRRLGCELGQGRYWCGPLPQREAGEFVEDL